MIKLIFIFLIIGCQDFDYRITKLEHEELKFKELPHEIRKYLLNPTDYRRGIKNKIIVHPVSDFRKYKLETVNTTIGPWVDYERLVDVEKNLSYKIEQGVPSPYIVYEEIFYIPNSYNMFTVGKIEDVIFTGYKLK